MTKVKKKGRACQPGQIYYPSPQGVNRMIPQETSERRELMVLFRIISRRSWDDLQSWHKACPGSTVEHLMKGTGLYVLTIPPGGAGEGEAA